MTVSISQSVGMQGGVNRPEDVAAIEDLLNRIPTDQGGPQIPVTVDGYCARETELAIHRFQLHHFGWAGADGRVDPGGQTLTRMNAVATGTTPGFVYPTIVPDTSSPAALARSQNRPIAEAWIGAAIPALEAYRISLLAGIGNVGGIHDVTLAALETNFAWKRLASNLRITYLRDIVGTYQKIKVVLLQADAKFKNEPDASYSGDDPAHVHQTGGDIHFTRHFVPYDAVTDIGYGKFSRSAIVIHEAVHVVDFYSGHESTHISEWDEPRYSDNPPEFQKHNSSAYATFASQVFLQKKSFPASERYGAGAKRPE